MTQIDLNYSVPPQDRKRISKQCIALLERLRRGPMTNREGVVELNILNLTARCSELRQAGHDVRATRISGGLFSYTLVVAPVASGAAAESLECCE